MTVRAMGRENLVRTSRLHSTTSVVKGECDVMGLTVKFTYQGCSCEAAFVEQSTASAMQALRDLLRQLPDDAGEVSPVLVARCPSCGADRVRFSYVGDQPWADEAGPPLELWNCPECHTTLSTGGIVRPCCA